MNSKLVDASFNNVSIELNCYFSFANLQSGVRATFQNSTVTISNGFFWMQDRVSLSFGGDSSQHIVLSNGELRIGNGGPKMHSFLAN